MLNARFKEISNAETVCYDRFSGTQEEMAKMVSTVYAFSPSWVWTSDEHTEVVRVKAKVWTLIQFLAVQIGIPVVNQTTWKEVFTRVAMLEQVGGAFNQLPSGEGVPYTPEDIQALIGLNLNVNEVSKTKFNGVVAAMARRNAEALVK